MNLDDFTIILASASPRRKQILETAGFTFDIIPSDKEEETNCTEPSDVVMNLANQKASDVYTRLRSNDDYKDKSILVIGADTIVALDGNIMGKPKDYDEAYNMLKTLSDNTHQVFTGVTIMLNRNGIKETYMFYEKSDVTFYPLKDEEIKNYIDTKDPFDKAGSYGIQGTFAKHVRSITGDYNNIVGLPVARIYQELKKILKHRA